MSRGNEKDLPEEKTEITVNNPVPEINVAYDLNADHTRASITLKDPSLPVPTYDEIVEYLTRNGIVEGIKYDAIRNFVESEDHSVKS